MAAVLVCGVQVFAGPPEFFIPMADPPAWLMWDAEARIRSVGGYRENALLASTNRQSVAFAGWGGNLTLIHLPLDGNSFDLVVSGDDRRYLHSLDPGQGTSPSTGEREMIAEAVYKRYIGKRWLPALSVRDVYTDQVFDAASVLQRYSVRSQLHEISVTPSLRYTLPHHIWIEGGYSWQRNLFTEPLDSYWENGPKAAVGWDYRDKCSFEIQYRYTDVRYDTLPESDVFGNPIDSGPQRFAQQHVELVWKHEWLDHPRVRTSLQPTYIRNTDLAASQYYSFDRYGISGTVRLSIGWLALEGYGRWLSYSYDTEAVSQVQSDTPLAQEEYQARGRAEITLTDHLFLIAEYSWERLRSNKVLTPYRSTLAWAGLEWRL